MSREFSMNNPENKTLAEIRAEAYQQGKEDALNDLIEEVKIEIDDIYNWDDDDYFVGMRAGYLYSIEIAERLKVRNGGKKI